MIEPPLVRCPACKSYVFLQVWKPIGIDDCAKCNTKLIWLDRPEDTKVVTADSIGEETRELIAQYQSTHTDSIDLVELVLQIEDELLEQ